MLTIIIIFLVITLSYFYLFKNKNLKNNAKIEQPIYNLLTEFFEIDYNNKPLDYSNVVNNHRLITLLTLNKNRFLDYKDKYKKFKVKINSIYEKDSNNYIVELQVLQGEKMDIKTDYTCLIQKENNKYYINRIINNILLEDRNPENFITNDNLYNDYIKNFVDSIQKQNN